MVRAPGVNTRALSRREKEKRTLRSRRSVASAASARRSLLAAMAAASSQRASASLLQRRLKLGDPRAARLLDQLEEMGVVGPSQGGGRERDVLIEPGEDDVPDALDE